MVGLGNGKSAAGPVRSGVSGLQAILLPGEAERDDLSLEIRRDGSGCLTWAGC